MALVCHWHMTNSEDSQNLLGRILDFCVESMEKCIGQYGRKCHRNEKRISWVTGCAHGQKFERGHLVFSLYGPKKHWKMPAKQAGIHAEVLHHVLRPGFKAGGGWGVQGC